jgi:hypothetical protein
MVRCTWCDGPVRHTAALHERCGAGCDGCQWWVMGWAQEGTDHPWTPPTPNPPLIDGGPTGYIHDVPLNRRPYSPQTPLPPTFFPQYQRVTQIGTPILLI